MSDTKNERFSLWGLKVENIVNRFQPLEAISTNDAIEQYNDLLDLARIMGRLLDKAARSEKVAPWMPTPEQPMFNEDALRDEIAKVWGAHGAHSEVYRMLCKLAFSPTPKLPNIGTCRQCGYKILHPDSTLGATTQNRHADLVKRLRGLAERSPDPDIDYEAVLNEAADALEGK